MRVLKFGGSSVANADRIREVIRIIADAASRDADIAVVVSAQGGVTDELERLCQLVLTDKKGADAIVQQLDQKVVQLLHELLPVTQLPASTAHVLTMINELANLVKGASLIGEVTKRTKDLIFSFGERLSATIITEALKQLVSDAVYADARLFIRTDSNFGFAKVDFNITNAGIQDYFSTHKGLKVVTGFIGSNEQGETTTLGRSGSDYTASIIGAALRQMQLKYGQMWMV
jgi:bifunctional aspartokinase / homoserine dehydrogenase 1